jgi:hypothetical protein
MQLTARVEMLNLATAEPTNTVLPTALPAVPSTRLLSESPAGGQVGRILCQNQLQQDTR